MGLLSLVQQLEPVGLSDLQLYDLGVERIVYGSDLYQCGLHLRGGDVIPITPITPITSVTATAGEREHGQECHY